MSNWEYFLPGTPRPEIQEPKGPGVLSRIANWAPIRFATGVISAPARGLGMLAGLAREQATGVPEVFLTPGAPESIAGAGLGGLIGEGIEAPTLGGIARQGYGQALQLAGAEDFGTAFGGGRLDPTAPGGMAALTPEEKKALAERSPIAARAGALGGGLAETAFGVATDPTFGALHFAGKLARSAQAAGQAITPSTRALLQAGKVAGGVYAPGLAAHAVEAGGRAMDAPFFSPEQLEAGAEALTSGAFFAGAVRPAARDIYSRLRGEAKPAPVEALQAPQEARMALEEPIRRLQPEGFPRLPGLMPEPELVLPEARQFDVEPPIPVAGRSPIGLGPPPMRPRLEIPSDEPVPLEIPEPQPLKIPKRAPGLPVESQPPIPFKPAEVIEPRAGAVYEGPQPRQRPEPSEVAEFLAQEAFKAEADVFPESLERLTEGRTPEEVSGVSAEAAHRLLSLREGRQFLGQLEERFGVEGPDLEVVPVESSPGDVYVVQRYGEGAERRVVGGAVSMGQARGMLAGGRAYESPVSISPVYEALTKAGIEPSNVLTPYGEAAQRKGAARVATTPELGPAAGARPEVQPVPPPGSTEGVGPAPRASVEAAALPEPARAPEVAPEVPLQAATSESVGVPFFIPRNVQQALADLGYSREARNWLTPQEAQDILTRQQRASEVSKTALNQVPEDPYLYHGAPKRLAEKIQKEGLLPGSFLSPWADSARNFGESRSGKQTATERYDDVVVFKVQKSEVSPLEASPEDVFGQSWIDHGLAVRSAKAHRVEPLEQPLLPIPEPSQAELAPKPESIPQPPKPSPLDRLSQIESDILQRNKERIKKITSSTQMGGLLESPGVLRDVIELGAIKIARGAVKFAEWVVEMVREFGDYIRPHLQGLWTKAQAHFEKNRVLREAAEKAEPGSPAWMAHPERGAAVVGPSGVPGATMPPPAPPTPSGPARGPLKPIPGPSKVRPEGMGAKAAEAFQGRGPEPVGTKPPEAPYNTERVGTEIPIKEAEAAAVEALRREFGEARGYRSWAEAEQKALESGITEADFHRLYKEKGVVTDHEMEAGRGLKADAAKRAFEAGEKVKQARASGEDTLDAERVANLEAARWAAITYDVVGAKAEVARALAIMRAMESPLSPQEQLFQKVLREVPTLDETARTRLAKAVASGDQAAMRAEVEKVFQPTAMDKFLEWYKGSLILNPPTILGNLVGNAFFEGAIRTPERGVAGVLEQLGIRQKLEKYMRGEAVPQERFPGEALAAFKTHYKVLWGLPQAFRAMWHSIFVEKPLVGPKGEVQLPAIRPGEVYRGKSSVRRAISPVVQGVQAPIGKGIRTGFRMMEAADTAAKSVAANAEIASQGVRAVHQASIKRGKALTGAEASTLADGIRERATSYIDAKFRKDAGKVLSKEEYAILRDAEAKRIGESAIEEGKKATWTDESGKLVKGLMALRSDVKILHVPLPFVKTPGRILAGGLERTPYGFIKAFRDIRSGKIQGGQISDALAKPVFGTLLGLGFYLMAKSDFITGSGPTDPDENKVWRATGKQPYSVYIPGAGYVSYRRLEPLATILGIAGDMAEAVDEKKAANLWGKLWGSVGGVITDKSFLQGAVNFAEAWADPFRYGGKLFQDLEGAMIPGVIARTAEAIDPTLRERKGILGPIVARIPGLSSTLPARRSPLGEPIKREQTAVERLLTPFTRTPEKPAEETALERELLDIGEAPSPPERNVTIPGTKGRKAELTQQEYEVFQDEDKKASDFLRKSIKTGGWRALSGDEKVAFVKRVYGKANQRARKKVMPRVVQRYRSAQLG